MYYADASEVFVIPSIGGDPIRLAANDPPACSGVTSPGIINSWPPSGAAGRPQGRKDVLLAGVLVGPRRLRHSAGAAQARLAAVHDRDRRHPGEVTDTIETFPAIYLWNQSTGESNHTPAWDAFELPDVD